MEDKIKWQKTISRQEAVIRSELIVKGASLNIPNVTGTECNNFIFIRKNRQGSAYFDKNQIQKIGLALAEKIKHNPTFAKKHIQALKGASQNLVSISQHIGKRKDLQSLTLKKLKELFEKFVQTHFSFSPYMFTPFGIERVLGEKVKKMFLKEGLSEEDFLRAIEPIKAPSTILEKRELNKIANFIKKRKLRDYNSLLENHWKRFSWLAVYSPTDKPFTLEHFKKRLEILLERTDKSQKEATSHTLDLKGIPSETNRLLKLLREYVYLRTYRVEMLSKAYFYIQPLFLEICRRGKITLQDAEVITLDEFLHFLSGNKFPNKKQIKKRQKLCGYLMKDSNFQFHEGDKIEKILEKEMGKGEGRDNNLRVLKGMPAYKGRVRGKVKIVSKDNLNKFQKGEVLVTTMTSPDFMPILDKALAIVTDEGGVTCHAAIVAREMKIPCIVGTKIATQVLEDGDIIKVDAIKGVVKKLG